jgi:putative transcriptional regulator
MRLILTIRKWRERRGLSQAELAKRVGVRQATISRLETEDSRRIELDVLDALARALRCEPADLLERVPSARGGRGKRR